MPFHQMGRCLGGIVLAVWAIAPALGSDVVCKPTPCFAGNCSADLATVTFKANSFNVMAWQSDNTKYAQLGTVSGHSMVRDEFGIFLHGPLFRPAMKKAQDYVPPLYIVGSLTDKIWRLDDITLDQGTVSAKMKLLGYAASPSTMFPIQPAYTGGPERLLIAEGNPFEWNPDPRGGASWWQGGVDLMDEHNCTTIFPRNKVERTIGRVVNTVECHPSGFCFFSVWKFYDDSLPLPSPDCLYWCRVTNINDPTSCVESEVMKDNLGNSICHVDGMGAVHGFKIGKDVASNSFDMFLLYTGKGTFDDGDSSIYKMRVTTGVKNGHGQVTVESSMSWGTDLWQKSTTPGHNVGVDHAWIDDTGNHVWVGTFRKKSDGVHMLEYDTGKLVHSIFGISDIVPKKYTYTSGITGIGSWGKAGSVIAIATCMEFGQQFLGGTSAVVLIDISNATASRVSGSFLV